jgi:hypothetical protein
MGKLKQFQVVWAVEPAKKTSQVQKLLNSYQPFELTSHSL